MAGFYGEMIARNSRELLFSIAAGRGDAPALGIKGQHWFPLALIQITREPETGFDFLIVPTELALLRRGEQMAKDDLTRDELERFFELNEKKKALNRQAENLDREAALIKPKIKAFIEKNAGKTLSYAKWGFNLLIKHVAGTPKWKDEFIRVAGADEATKVSDAAPKQERLTVERVV